MKLSFDKFIIGQSPSNLNYGKLCITNDSRYSSLMPWHVQTVTKILDEELYNENINSIVDTCANIGVDTILFRLMYPYADITAIELNKNTFNALKENMDNISQITSKYRKNIQILNMDCLDYIYTRSCDLIYFDPPWPENYKNGKINLTLSGQYLGDIINQVVNNSIVIAKLPFNFDQDSFEYQINKNEDHEYVKATINYHTIYTNGKNPKISYILAFIRKL